MIFEPPASGMGRKGKASAGTVTLTFREIHPMLEGVLRAASLDPWERCPSGSERLLPTPGDDEELTGDWHDHVQPELRSLFSSARSLVAEDLDAMACDSKGYWRLEIPPSHAEAWMVTLNAIRLSLAGEHGLDERDLSDDGEGEEAVSEKGFALMQVNLFAFMQECLVRHAPGL